MASNTKSIGPFPLGMDNRAPDFKLALPDGAGHYLRDALNVDAGERGSIKTRQGYTLVSPGQDCHSMWAPIDGAYALLCDDGVLYRMGRDANREQVAAGFGSVTPVRYAQVNEAVYFTDGIRPGSYHPVAGPTPEWASATSVDVGEQLLTPMPPGSCIAHHGGRLLVAVGAVLVYSEPFTPHLRDAARGYEMFPAPITCIAAVEGGVFVMADKTYFIAGGFPAQTVRAVLSYGAPEQQAGYRSDGSAHWMSSKGVVSCTPGGELQNLQEKNVALDAQGSAATLWREADGTEVIVAALSAPSSTAAGVGSYAQARIVKKE
ncbi:hypothetical protein [Acidovorax sp. RAC01]|uniref:hypothetical protein n=1 Tax=Acidovorax sp. RAC01 TaxID=1842533 RepID=UPI00083E8F1C|nr:hypothetical protein [Acidovorax sp. RAC01]AOG21919.1 hypothetical protein BSY15_3740 [Acidovorax sp. RAC01]AOG22226.1 hypothetical protein BSY15_3818 [Acidovorax sp. RAC01]